MTSKYMFLLYISYQLKVQQTEFTFMVDMAKHPTYKNYFKGTKNILFSYNLMF